MKHWILAATILALASVLASAHQGATGIVKQRMDAMKALGGQMKALSQLDWSNPAQSRVSAAAIADEITGHARQMPALFPKGSTQHPSEAIDAIWSNPAEFAEAVKALEAAADQLRTAAPALQRADDVKQHLRQLGATCSACHADFRKKRQ